MTEGKNKFKKVMNITELIEKQKCGKGEEGERSTYTYSFVALSSRRPFPYPNKGFHCGQSLIMEHIMGDKNKLIIITIEFRWIFFISLRYSKVKEENHINSSS